MPNATQRARDFAGSTQDGATRGALGENGGAPGSVPTAYLLNSAPPVPADGLTPERAAAGDKWYAGLPESKALTGAGPFGKLASGR